MSKSDSKVENEIRRSIQDRIDALFGDFPESTDWADDIARYVVAMSLDMRTAFALDGDRWTQEQQDAWALAAVLAPELRGLKSQARDAEIIRVQGETEKARRMLRKEFASPDFMSNFIRDAASILDGRGLAGEANVLRDAAAILDTEF